MMATIETDPKESKRLAVQRCMALLEHAYQCRDVICRLPSCQQLKGFLTHAETCKRKGSCKICEMVKDFKSCHSENCQETKCPLPFCLNVKLKQQAMEEAQNLNRSTEVMHNTGLTESINQTSPGSSTPTNHPSPDTKHLVPQPGIGMKQSECPPAGALQAVQQVQDADAIPNPNGSAPGAKKITQGMANPGTSAASAMRQKNTTQFLQQLVTFLKSPNCSRQNRQQAMHFLKANPGLMVTFTKLISGQRQQNIQPRQPLGPRPQSQMMGANPNSSVSPLMETPQGGANPGTSASSAIRQRSNAQFLQQIVTSLKSPNFPQQKKQQFLQLLKANPHIMAAFIKHMQGQPRGQPRQ